MDVPVVPVEDGRGEARERGRHDATFVQGVGEADRVSREAEVDRLTCGATDRPTCVGVVDDDEGPAAVRAVGDQMAEGDGRGAAGAHRAPDRLVHPLEAQRGGEQRCEIAPRGPDAEDEDTRCGADEPSFDDPGEMHQVARVQVEAPEARGEVEGGPARRAVAHGPRVEELGEQLRRVRVPLPRQHVTRELVDELVDAVRSPRERATRPGRVARGHDRAADGARAEGHWPCERTGQRGGQLRARAQDRRGIVVQHVADGLRCPSGEQVGVDGVRRSDRLLEEPGDVVERHVEVLDEECVTEASRRVHLRHRANLPPRS